MKLTDMISSLTTKISALLLAVATSATLPYGAWALSGTGTEADPYLIGTLADLQEFRNNVNNGNTYANQYVKLTADIDLSSVADWAPIGTSANMFSGVFDGNGKTITGLTITGSSNYVGLFGYVTGIENGSFTQLSDIWQNNTLDEAKIAESEYTAVVKNVKLSGVDVAGGARVGALIAKATNAYILNCEVFGKITGKGKIASVVAETYDCVVKSCVNNATITNNGTDYNIGGVVGCARGSHANAVINCTNKGVLTVTLNNGGVGGVVGQYSGAALAVVGCTNSGNITVTSTVSGANNGGMAVAGGIVGTSGGDKPSYIANCTNSGNITTANDTESPAGQLSGIVSNLGNGADDSLIYACSNTGTVSGKAWYVGGICAYPAGATTVSGCTNSGTVSSTVENAPKSTIVAYTKARTVYSNMAFESYEALMAAVPSGTGTYILSDSVTVGGTSVAFTNTNGTIEIATANAEIEIPSAITMNSLIVRGANAKVTIPAGMDLTKLTVSGSGATVVNNGSVSGELVCNATCTVINNGSIGPVTINAANCKITNSAGKTMGGVTVKGENAYFNNNGTVDGGIGIYATGAYIVNNGMIEVDDKSTVVRLWTDGITATVYNNGTITSEYYVYWIEVNNATLNVTDEPSAAYNTVGNNNDRIERVVTTNNGVTYSGSSITRTEGTHSAAIITGNGITPYATLAEALNDYVPGTSQTDTLSLLEETAWPVATPVWYNGMFYATLSAAISAANEANAATAAVIHIRPGYQGNNAFTGAHDNIKTSITIYGHDASLNRTWEPTIEYPGTAYHELTKDVTFAIYNLHDGAGAWGARTTSYTSTVILENCKNVHEVLLNGNTTTIIGNNVWTIKNCTFDASHYAAAVAVGSMYPVTLNMEGCTFTGINGNYTININNKIGGTSSGTIKDCTFDNCGTSEKGAIRFNGEEATATVSATLSGLTFNNSNNLCDIQIGHASSASDNNAVVNYEISNTTGTLKVYEQGTTTLANDGATSIVASQSYTGNNEPLVATVTFLLTDSVGKMSIHNLDENIYTFVNGEFYNGSYTRTDVTVAFTQTVSAGGTATRPVNASSPDYDAAPSYDYNVMQPNNGSSKEFTSEDSHQYTFDGWATQDDELYDFSTPVTSDLTLHPRFSATGATIEIATEADLLKFNREALLVRRFRDGSAGTPQTVKLTADITLTSEWTPIPSTFYGIFDGNGYSITGLNISSTEDQAGFFKAIGSNNVVRNLTFVNPTITSTASGVGVLAGEIDKVAEAVDNVHIKGTINVRGKTGVGGLVGYLRDGAEIRDCSVDGTGTIRAYDSNGNDGRMVGGLVGDITGDGVKISDCSVIGVTVSGMRKIGGLIGQTQNRNNNTDPLVCTGIVVSNVTIHSEADTTYTKALTMGGVAGQIVNNFAGSSFAGTVSDITMTGPESSAHAVYIMGLVSGGTGNAVPASETALDAATFNILVSGTNTRTIETVSSHPGINGSMPATYVAQIVRDGEVVGKYETLAEAVAAAVNGGTITLLADVEANVVNISGAKSITLDLNGHTISGAANSQAGLVSVSGGASLTINATNGGAITADSDSPAVYVSGTAGGLTVNGGTFDGRCSVMYETPSENTVVTINNGTFKKVAGSDCGIIHANLLSNNGHPTATTVYKNGGTYSEYQARVSLNGDDLCEEMVDGMYVIKKTTDLNTSNAIAKVTNGTDVYYYYAWSDMYKAPRNEIREGDTVTLLQDLSDIGNTYIPRNFTLDGNGHTISGNSQFSRGTYPDIQGVTITNVTFKDISDGKANGNLSALVFGNVNGALEITDCVFDNIQYDAIQIAPIKDSADIQITDNEFKNGAGALYLNLNGGNYSGGTAGGAVTVSGNTFDDEAKKGAARLRSFATDDTLSIDGNYFENIEQVLFVSYPEESFLFTSYDALNPDGTIDTTSGTRYEVSNADTKADSSVAKFVPVAMIGTTEYSTLAKAFAATTDGGTIDLLADNNEDVTVSSAMTFYIKANGNTYSGTVTAGAGYILSSATAEGVTTFTVTVDPYAAYVKVADGFYQSGTTYNNSADFYITNLNGLKFFRDLVNGETAASYAYFEATGVTTTYPKTPSGINSFHSNNMFSGKTVHLCEDIDLAGEQWLSIGFNRNARTITDPDTSVSASVQKCYFYGLFDAGIYDGEGNLTGTHVISNLDTSWEYAPEAATLESKYQMTGLFGMLAGGTTTGVKNLTVRNATVVGRTDVGVIAGRIYLAGAKIENCHVVGNVNVTGSSTYVGGLVGECRGSIIDSSRRCGGRVVYQRIGLRRRSRRFGFRIQCE